MQSTFQLDETPIPPDVNEVLAWDGPDNGWTTARRGGEDRDGVVNPGEGPDLHWWVWSFGITAKFEWWRFPPAAPLSQERK